MQRLQHVWHFTDWGLESCLQRPVHLPLVSESCWEFSLGLLFNSVFNASISALSSCNSALAFCRPSSSFWQVFSLEIHKVALHLDQSELQILASPYIRLSLKLATPFLLGRDSNIQLVNKFFICNPWIVQVRAQFVLVRSEASVMAQTISPNMVISWASCSGGLINFVRP